MNYFTLFCTKSEKSVHLALTARLILDWPPVKCLPAPHAVATVRGGAAGEGAQRIASPWAGTERS